VEVEVRIRRVRVGNGKPSLRQTKIGCVGTRLELKNMQERVEMGKKHETHAKL